MGDSSTFFSVLFVLETRVVNVFDSVSRSQDFLTDVIEVLNFSREPWDFRSSCLSHCDGQLSEFEHALFDFRVVMSAVEINVKIHSRLIL
jgi:hypothetical protein